MLGLRAPKVLRCAKNTRLLCAEALAQIKLLYNVERQASEIFKTQTETETDDKSLRTLAEIRLELRQEHSVKILAEFKAWLKNATRHNHAEKPASVSHQNGNHPELPADLPWLSLPFIKTVVVDNNYSCILQNTGIVIHGLNTVYDIQYHLVWVTKYRYRIMVGEVVTRVRDLIRQICMTHDVTIIKGHVGSDHVHLLVSSPSAG